MPVVSDYEPIIGDSHLDAGDLATGQRTKFNTGGRESSKEAFVIFSHRGLTSNARALVNGQDIGTLVFNASVPKNLWQTQMLALRGDVLRDGSNTFQVDAVGNPELQMRNLICFFRQSA
jgi:hypothetical protein